MTEIHERMVRVETKLDVLAAQWDTHVRARQWMVGIGVMWLTILMTLYKVL
jgi:hypothetical protein